MSFAGKDSAVRFVTFLKRLIPRQLKSDSRREFSLSGFVRLLVLLTVLLPKLATAETSSENPEITDLLRKPGSQNISRTCSIRVEGRQYPCRLAWFLVYKDGENDVQFNRGTADDPVISFVGRAFDANTISITSVNIRMGSQSAPSNDYRAVGQCILGEIVATCQARLSNGMLVLGEITDKPLDGR